MEKNYKILTSKHLKIIAYLTMLIDHIGAVIVLNLINNYYASYSFMDIDQLFIIYTVLRKIGRIAFPIFAFSTFEGFQKTSNVEKYILRLFIFALISEVPFDLAFYKVPFYWEYQNVIWTLLIGVLVLYFEKRFNNRYLGIGFLIVGMALSEIIASDYGAYGVSLVYLFYLFRNMGSLKYLFWGGLILYNNAFALLALIPLFLYNGRKGMGTGRVLYYFYPIHLLFLYLIVLII